MKNGQKIVDPISNKIIFSAESLGFNSREISQIENIGKIEKNISNTTENALSISQDVSFTNHALQRAVERGVSKESILATLRFPLKIEEIKIDNLGRPSQRFIGQKAEVAINPETKQIVSVNPTSTKKIKKLTAELSDVKN